MEQKKNSLSTLERLNRAFGPLAGALILDLVDLASMGPLGVGGLVIGTAVGYWILGNYELSTGMRWILAILAGIYCLVPFTEFVPAATLITAVARYVQKSKG